MNESEWFACTDPAEMVRFLHGEASERKLRLFAVACCRRIWDSITERCSRQAVKVSERYAEKRANYEHLEAAFMAADWAFDKAFDNPEGRMPTWHALDAARLVAHPEIRGLADGTATSAAMAGAGSGEDFWMKYANEQVHQCILLRDIFGNPFHPVVPSWLTPRVVNLAKQIYEHRAFDRLPALADALEEAGCDSADILDHCRLPGVHVRGCWVIDLMLRKK